MSVVPDPMSWSWPAEVSSVSTARHTVVDWLRGHRMPDPPLSDIALLVSEAVTNAVTHAYVGQPPGAVRVQVIVDQDEVMVAVEDEGHGLRPRPDSPGLGYGLALMVAVSKRFEAQSGDDEGTRLRAWFSRDPAQATLPE
ncbi:transcriptional regulator [Baekduia alba]|uniref:ATP-binding protein n=1 Tax=Baekduia alba TaxID=2997333 RepID=UPI00233FAA49|nr:ATP-binding protein [Baekduia alba]WCB92153.1 transcriptional regulator [Baekduia alba]